MKRRLFSYGFPVLLLILFAASLYWTLLLFIPAEVPSAEAPKCILRFSPDYTVISRKTVSIWPAGTVFEHGNAEYFYAVMPDVDITPALTVEGNERTELSGTIKSSVFLTAENGSGAVLWTYEAEKLNPEEFNVSVDAASGGRTDFSGKSIHLDVPESADRAKSISGELGITQANHRLYVLTSITVTGSVGGRPFSHSYDSRFPVVLGDSSFTMPADNDIGFVQTIDGSDTPSSETQKGRTPLDYLTRALANLILLALVVLTFKLNNKNKDRGSGTEALVNRRFREWITEGRVQPTDRDEVRVFSLQGLVEMAIDLEKRVIYDPSKSKYYLIDNSLLYTFDPQNNGEDQPETKSRLGGILVRNGLIKPEQLEIGLMEQKRTGSLLGESLISLGFIGEVTLYSTLASQAGIPFLHPGEMSGLPDPVLLGELTAARARVLETVPMGIRQDGKLAFICSNPSRKGLRQALQNIFSREIELAAATPSSVFKLIDRWESETKKTAEAAGAAGIVREKPSEGVTQGAYLTKEEVSDFRSGYRAGKLDAVIFAKAAGFAGEAVLSHAPADTLLRWLVNNGYIESEVSHLMAALSSAVGNMDRLRRKELSLPGPLEILQQANYITNETVKLLKEQNHGEDGLEDFLTKNFIVSADTMRKVCSLLSVLQRILK